LDIRNVRPMQNQIRKLHNHIRRLMHISTCNRLNNNLLVNMHNYRNLHILELVYSNLPLQHIM
jgi:hypothetical protein